MAIGWCLTLLDLALQSPMAKSIKMGVTAHFTYTDRVETKEQENIVTHTYILYIKNYIKKLMNSSGYIINLRYNNQTFRYHASKTMIIFIYLFSFLFLEISSHRLACLCCTSQRSPVNQTVWCGHSVDFLLIKFWVCVNVFSFVFACWPQSLPAVTAEDSFLFILHTLGNISVYVYYVIFWFFFGNT